MTNSKLLQRTWRKLTDLIHALDTDPSPNMTPEGSLTRDKNLPEDECDIVEWKEGPDKVIEKRGAPGEDVSAK